MRTWTRWQDWVAVAAGVYAVLSTSWTLTNGAATTAMIVLGVLIVIAALINLARPRLVQMEWATAILGALMFISPWVLAYTSLTGQAWSAWIAGGVTIIVGLWGLSWLRGLSRGQAPPARA